MSKYFNLQTIITSAIVALIIVVAVVSTVKVYEVGADGKVAKDTKASGKLKFFGPKKPKGE